MEAIHSGKGRSGGLERPCRLSRCNIATNQNWMFTCTTQVLERDDNYDIIEAMYRPNKGKKDPVTEWAVGQPLVMQTEQETTRKTKLGSPPTVSRVKKTVAAKQISGARKKTAVAKSQPKNKRTSP
jgi:hypothetical protein